MAKTELTIALASFDRHVPFFMGWIPEAARFRLRALDVGIHPPGRDGGNRHGRMLRDGAFDIAEVSLSSYLMARSEGRPFTAVPVFPRRLFSQHHLFVYAGANIRSPADLAGRRVAIRSFQVTLSVLAKGDLAREYGVPWRSIRWVVQEPEEIDWAGQDAIQLERMPPGVTGAELLRAGAVDAYIDPRPPATILNDRAVRPLFDDRHAECVAYFRRRGIFPIMHLLVIRQAVADAFPELPAYLIEAWEDAKARTRSFYEDPAYTMMPFGREDWERSAAAFGPDPFPSGLRRNAANLAWFQDEMVDQTLLRAPLSNHALFHPSTHDS